MQNVGERKKFHASTYPKKKNSWGIKWLKKNFMRIPNHPTPPSEVKWLAPKATSTIRPSEKIVESELN